MMLYKISYILDPRNVLKYKNDNGKELLDVLLQEINSRIPCDRLIKLGKSFNELNIVICSSQVIEQSQLESINSAISQIIETGNISMNLNEVSAKEILQDASLSESDKKYLSEFSGVDISQPLHTESQAPEAESIETKIESPEEDVFESVDKLIAMGELKSWIKEMKALSEKNIAPEMLSQSLMSMSYLVSANDGNGCTTMFRTMGKVLCKLLGKKDVVLKEVYIEPDKESKSFNVTKVISDLSYIEENSNNLYVFAIGIDKMQNNSYMNSWIQLLSGLRAQSKKAVFIFVLPYLENVVLREMHEKIKDIMPNRILAVKPFTNDDYLRFFEMYFKKFNMSIAEEAYAVFPQKIAEEKSDGRFYGINTINKICDEILYEKIKNIVVSEEDSQTVTADDVKALLQKDDLSDSDAQTGMEKLDSLISLEDVKKRIKEIVATVKMQRKMHMDSKNSIHMMFSGAPGTGKTVVARILGQILREEKILSAGGFYEVSRKDLVGSYVGHTAPKTAEVCKLAYGSVLFIDEAYTLDGGSDNDYGKEAIGTLIAEMENKRDDFVVIFAGYDRELEKLFELNPGLRDRIPYRVHFTSYNKYELQQIFYKMLPNDFGYTDEFKAAADDFFENLSEDLMTNPHFSNARFVRNLVERVISKASLRLHMDEGMSSDMVLSESDFNLAIADSEFRKLNEKKKKITIGF